MAKDSSVLHKNILLGVCLIIAICSKILLQYYFLDFEDDKVLQAIAAKSILLGHGPSVPTVYGTDLTTVVYTPVLAWPPGYSLLMIPFYILDGQLVESTLVMDAFATILFFIVYFLLLKKLEFTTIVTCLLLLFNGVFLTQNIVSSTPTDLLALSLLLLSLYYFLRCIERNTYTHFNGICISLLCFLPVLFRYLYLPVAFVIPFFVCWLGYRTRNKEQLKCGIIALASTAVLSIVLLYYMKTVTGITGNNPPLKAATFSFYPVQVQLMHPFLISAIINLDFAAQQVSNFTGYKYQTILRFVSYIHYVLLLIVIICLYRLFKQKMTDKLTKKDLFFFAGLGVCFAVIGSLIFLSLTTKIADNAINHTSWTYIQEERYYIFAAVFLPLLVFFYVRPNWENIRRKFKQALYYSLLFLLTFETLHGFYFIGRRVLPNIATQPHIAYYNTYQSFLKAFVASQIASGNEVVLGGTINPYFWYARGYPVKPLLNVTDLNQSLYAYKSTVLLVGLNDAALPQFRPFLAKNGIKEVFEQGDTHFYSLHFKSHERK